MAAHVVPVRTYYLIFAALMIGTGITVAASFVDLGALNTIALTIATVVITLGAGIGTSLGAGLQDFAAVERGRYLATAADCGVVPAFAKDFRVLSYDLRGAGQSEVPPAEYSVENGHLVDLLELLKVTGLKPPYHVYARLSTYSGPNIEFYQIPDRILDKLGFNTATESYGSATQEEP